MTGKDLLIVASVVAYLGILVGIIWGVIAGYRKFQASCARKLAELFNRYHEDNPAPGIQYMTIDYPLYWGFFVTLATAGVHWRVRRDKARDCLAELLRFNLTRGVWGAGALFVPFSARHHYKRQMARLMETPQTSPPDTFPRS